MKKGAGTLTLDMKTHKAGFSFTNDIEIVEGKILTASGCQGAKGDGAVTSSALGNPFVKRRIHIHDGAELELGGGNVFSFIALKNLLVDICVESGGWGVLCVYDTFRFAGTTPYVFPASDGGGRFLLSYYPTSRYEVEDVSGDSGDDVTFENELKDFLGTGDVNAYAASSLIKDGPGTMRACDYQSAADDPYGASAVAFSAWF